MFGETYADELTTVQWELGELSCTVQMRANLSPDMVDDILLKGRRQFIAAARQLDIMGVTTGNPEA